MRIGQDIQLFWSRDLRSGLWLCPVEVIFIKSDTWLTWHWGGKDLEEEVHPFFFSLSCCLVSLNFWLDVSTDDDCVFHSTKVINMWIHNAHIQRLAIPRYCSWLHHWSKKRRSYANASTKRFDVGPKRMVFEMSRDQSRGIRWWIGDGHFPWLKTKSLEIVTVHDFPPCLHVVCGSWFASKSNPSGRVCGSAESLEGNLWDDSGDLVIWSMESLVEKSPGDMLVTKEST